MNLTRLKTRDKITCKLAEGDGSEYVVRIDEVIDEETILTDLPIMLSGKVHFRLGTLLDMVYTDKNGVFYFQGKVVEYTPDKSFMLIRRIGEGGRIQRRNYFRLAINLTCQVRLFANFFVTGKEIDSCVVENVSAGGIKLMTNRSNYQPGELYHLEIDGFHSFRTVWAEVLSIEPIPAAVNSAFTYYAVLKFSFLKAREIDDLVRLLMVKEREQSKLRHDDF